MKIVLCVTPVFHSETAPLGLGYLKSNLEASGHDVVCLDFSRQHRMFLDSLFGQSSVTEYLNQHPEIIASWLEEIRGHSPEIVGISIWNSTQGVSRLLAGEIRKSLPGVLIVGGGPQCVGEDISACLKYVDYVVENEGEKAFPAFIDEYSRHSKVRQVKGVWYKDGSKVCSSGAPERIKDLDALVFPDFSDFPMQEYSEGVPIQFSRGCWANCTFCPGKKYFTSQISRTGINVFKEIKYQIQATSRKKFVFADDSLLSHVTLREFIDLCDRIIEEDLGITWRIYGQRIDPLITPPLAGRLVKAGLNQITFGVESFSPEVRRDMGKTESQKITEENLFSFIEQGVQVNLLMIYGYPSETDEEFKKTLHWIEKNGGKFHHICFNCFVLNSEYYRRRPRSVTFEKGFWHLYRWYSGENTLEKRKERFLEIAGTLSKLGNEYLISEPCLTKYYKHWDSGLEDEIRKKWDNWFIRLMRTSFHEAVIKYFDI